MKLRWKANKEGEIRSVGTDRITSRILGAMTLLLALGLPAWGEWQPLGTGLELGTFPLRAQSSVGDSTVTILRIEPRHWELVAIGRSWPGESENLTARAWGEKHELTAVINAGMFGTDYQTHVGHLSSQGHVNNGRVNDYLSVAAFDLLPGKSGPPFDLFDLDDPDLSMASILKRYDSVVQNLRLIKKPGENRWSAQSKKWSEAALGVDTAGRILFIFCRSPYSMKEFNHQLLGLGIGLVAAQHLEGGPEAQLYWKVGDHVKEMMGSYETSFREDDTNDQAWPIPNVLGIRPRSPETSP